MRSLSKKRQRELKAYNEAKAKVWVRCKGRCEVYGCSEMAVDCHHVFGKDIAELRVTPEVQSALCRSHHEAVTGRVGSGLDVELRTWLKWRSVEMLGGDKEEIEPDMTADLWIQEWLKGYP